MSTAQSIEMCLQFTGDGVPAAKEDRAVDAAGHLQVGIGGADDDVRGFVEEVALPD